MKKDSILKFLAGAAIALACACCAPAVALADEPAWQVPGSGADAVAPAEGGDGLEGDGAHAPIADAVPGEQAGQPDVPSDPADGQAPEDGDGASVADGETGDVPEVTAADPVDGEADQAGNDNAADDSSEGTPSDQATSGEEQAGEGSVIPEGATLYSVQHEPATASQNTTGTALKTQAAPSVKLGVKARVQKGSFTTVEYLDGTSTTMLELGTVGKNLRLEQLKFSFVGDGGVQAQAYVQGVGWQAVGSSLGKKNKRIEAIRIILTGEASKWYDVMYAPHLQNKGWMAKKKNGTIAGSAAGGLRMEALRIWLTPKKTASSSATEGIINVRAKSHVQNIGWQTFVQNGTMTGTSGKSLRVEQLTLGLDSGIYDGALKIQAHVQNIGDMASKEGKTVTAGTTGKSLRMESVKIWLTGGIASEYDIVYRAHVQNIGWQPWVLNGKEAGTHGKSLRVEALQIKLVKHGSTAAPSQGVYYITLSSNMNKALKNSKLGKGEQTKKATFNANSMAERYYVWKNDDKTVSIQSVGTGLFLGGKDGKLVQLADSAAGTHWTVNWNKGYALTNNKGLSISLDGSNAIVGSGVTKLMFSSATLLPDGVYKMANAAKGTYMSLSGSEPYATGASIKVENSGAAARQAFRLRNIGGKVYSVTSACSTLPVETDGSIVRTSYAKGSSNQKWTVTFERSGGFVFKNNSSGKVLTARGGGAAGATVTHLAKGTAKAQRWLLARSSYSGNSAIARAASMIRNTGSGTRYMIAVDLSNHWLCIFRGSAGNWTLYQNWIISNGKHSTPTVTGDFTTGAKGYSFGHGYTCYYYTQFYNDYLFHSVKYYEGTRSIMDGRLGKYVSMGCVRMEIGNAQWIYDNIPSGTHVKVYN